MNNSHFIARSFEVKSSLSLNQSFYPLDKAVLLQLSKNDYSVLEFEFHLLVLSTNVTCTDPLKIQVKIQRSF